MSALIGRTSWTFQSPPRFFIQEGHVRVKPDITCRQILGPMQFRALNFFQQHGSDNRVPVLNAERQVCNKVELRSKKMDRRTRMVRRRALHHHPIFGADGGIGVERLGHENDAQTIHIRNSRTKVPPASAVPSPDFIWK